MLDEVTSDLDGNIENIVISLLEELANSAIIINVCHRKKLVESSTYIFVIEENRGIVETGTHQELKEKKEDIMNCFEMDKAIHNRRIILA